MEKGKFYAMKSKHPDLFEINDEIVHFIDNDFPLEDINKLAENDLIEVREATEQEKRLCYFASEYSKINRGIFVRQIDELEEFFKKNPIE